MKKLLKTGALIAGAMLVAGSAHGGGYGGQAGADADEAPPMPAFTWTGCFNRWRAVATAC